MHGHLNDENVDATRVEQMQINYLIYSFAAPDILRSAWYGIRFFIKTT